MYKALVIGCGNIGALYDFNIEDDILTHARALDRDKRFSLSIYDVNENLSNKVSKKYNCEVIRGIDKAVLHSFDCVSICTPTDTHYELLKAALRANVKLIICEKPISNKIKELNALKEFYLKGKSKVLINFIRRFQPAYFDLKQTVSDILKNDGLTNINIRYQKGFLNNCSHAIDTIEYLTDCKIELSSIKIHNKIFDHFADDPTLSLQAAWNNVSVTISGLSNVAFNFFEIDLYCKYHRIAIKNAGTSIEIFKAAKDKIRFQPLVIINPSPVENCLKDYMKYVINHAHDLLQTKKNRDNFSGSINLNMRILKYMNG